MLRCFSFFEIVVNKLKSPENRWSSGLLIFSDLPELADAIFADILPVEGGHVPGGAAENAGGLVLLQHDPVIFHEDLQLIPLGDIQDTAQLNGQNDPAQIVDLANDTSRLHVLSPHT